LLEWADARLRVGPFLLSSMGESWGKSKGEISGHRWVKMPPIVKIESRRKV